MAVDQLVLLISLFVTITQAVTNLNSVISSLFPVGSACTSHFITLENVAEILVYKEWIQQSLLDATDPKFVSGDLHKSQQFDHSNNHDHVYKYSFSCHLFVSTASKSTEVARLATKPSRDVYLFVSESSEPLDLTSLSNLKWKFHLSLPTGELAIPPDTVRSSIIDNGSYRIFRRKINLNGVVLSVAGLAVPPFMLISPAKKIIGGTFVRVFEAAAAMYNFTYDISTEKKPIGFPLPNGTWVGLIGDILYKRKDMGTCIRPTLHSFHLLDYTTFILHETTLFILAHPETHVRWNALVRPFKPSMWIFFGIAFLIFVPTLYASLAFNASTTHKDPEQRRRLLYQSCMFPYATTVEQGIDIQPGGRFLALIWLLSVVILICGYKEKLMGSLTFPETFSIPGDLSGVYERKDFRVIFHNWGSTMLDEFKNANDKVMSGIYKRLELETDAAKCVTQATFNQRTLCIGSRSFISVAMALNLTLSGTFQSYRTNARGALAFPFYISIPLQKNSVYTAAWEEISGRYRESGLVYKWNQDVLDVFKMKGRDWMLSQKDSDQYRLIKAMMAGYDLSVKALTPKHFIAVFIMLSICLVCSVGAFLTEFFMGLCRKRLPREPTVLFVNVLPSDWGNSWGATQLQDEKLRVRVA